jgi:hypothetical protein
MWQLFDTILTNPKTMTSVSDDLKALPGMSEHEHKALPSSFPANHRRQGLYGAEAMFGAQDEVPVHASKEEREKLQTLIQDMQYLSLDSDVLNLREEKRVGDLLEQHFKFPLNLPLNVNNTEQVITSFIVGAAGVDYLATALIITSTLQANDLEECVAPVLVEYVQEAKARVANFQPASLEDLDELFSASSEPRKYIWERSKGELEKYRVQLSSAANGGEQQAYRLLALSTRKRIALCHMEMDDAAVNARLKIHTSMFLDELI